MFSGTSHKLGFIPSLGILAAGGIVLAGPNLLAQAKASSNSQELIAQDTAHALPKFDVISIKPIGPKDRELNGFYTYPSGLIMCKGCTLEYLVMVAFGLQEYQISGGPSWAKDDNAGFDIQAKSLDTSSSTSATDWTPATIKLPPNKEMREKVQSLLMERFQLKFHHETREGLVYLLAKGNDKELKLKPPKDKTTYPWAGGVSGGWFGGGMRGENISMAQLATRLSRFLKHPVFDQTGLLGSFDFKYLTGDENNDSDITGFLLRAMKGIGLELKASKGPVETLVIDHAESPSAN